MRGYILAVCGVWGWGMGCLVCSGCPMCGGCPMHGRMHVPWGVQKKFIGQGGFSKQGRYLHPTTQKIIGLSLHVMFSTVLGRNCFFFNFHAVFGHFSEFDPTSPRAKFQALFQKNLNRWGKGGWWYGISRFIEERACGNSSAQWNWNWNFQAVIKKKSCGISMGLNCSTWNFHGV